MKSPRNRRAVSLVEILVACVIAVIALGATYYLFRQSRGTAGSTEDRLSVLHHGRLLLEQVKRDLACLYYRADNLQTTINITGDGASFCRAVDLAGLEPNLTRITYNFNSAEGAVTREGAGVGRTVYGNDAIKIRKFAFKLGKTKIGAREAGMVDVTFTLAKATGSDKTELTLTERVFPETLQSSGVGWND